MALDTAPIDIIILITRHDSAAWYNLAQIVPSFRAWTYSDQGRHAYAARFTVTRKTVSYSSDVFQHTTTLFGVLHSVNDQPAVVNECGNTWYTAGRVDRGNDLPAIMTKNGNRHWYIDYTIGRYIRPLSARMGRKNGIYWASSIATTISRPIYRPTARASGIIVICYTATTCPHGRLTARANGISMGY